MRKKWHFLLLILLFTISCEQDKDEIPPSISWESPSDNSTFDVLDAVPISARISDNENIESVLIRLISNQTSNQVLSTQSARPNQKEFQFSSFFELADSLLPSGPYYFQLEADDGENRISAFRNITINGIPKRRIQTLVSCSNGNGTTVYKDDINFNFSVEQSFTSQYLTSTINSHDQHYWFLSANSNQLIVYQLVDQNIAYTETYLSAFNQTFTDIVHLDRDVWIGIKDGEIDGFNQVFSNNYTYQTTTDRILNKIAVGDKYICASESLISGNQKSVSVLLRSSGFLRAIIPFNQDILEMYFYSDEKGLLFYNEGTGGRIAELDAENISIRTLNTLSSPVVNVLQINTNDYIIATETNIQRFTLSTNNLVPYLMEDHAVLAYDEVDNQLYVATANQLYRYTLGQLNRNATASLTDTIQGIDIRYNRN